MFNLFGSRSTQEGNPDHHGGNVGPTPISLGHYVDDKGRLGEGISYDGERHILLFGPNGTGKSTRFLIPNLLQLRGRSIVVIDPKGELAAITGKYRQTFSDVVILNPFGVLTDLEEYEGSLASDGFNPLRTLDPNSDSFNADAALLAEALVPVKSDTRDPHWPNSARKLITALIMHVSMTLGSRGSFADVRRLLTEPHIEAMEAEPDKGLEADPGSGLTATAREMVASKLEALRNKAGQFTVWNKEIQSIVSTADTETEALDDKAIARDLAKDGIDFRDLKSREMTVYVIIPPEMMERHAKWLRLVLSSALRAVLRRRRPGELPVLFIIDEFAALGHLQIIETIWALVRGYGIQLLPVLQDLNQLKSLYRDRWETFIGMAGATLAFGPNDLTTARWMSERAGETTAVSESYNTAASLLTARPNATKNFQSMKIPLLSVHRLFDTQEGSLYYWRAGKADTMPLFSETYFNVPELAERATDNPYYISEN